MEKEFDRWNEKKKQTDKDIGYRRFCDGEIWYCSFGVNLGVEIDGKSESFLRPAVVLHRFNKDMAIVAPTTTKRRDSNAGKYYISSYDEKGLMFLVCISQIRVISAKRLFRKIGSLNMRNLFFLLDKISEMMSGTPKTTNSAYAELSLPANSSRIFAREAH